MSLNLFQPFQKKVFFLIAFSLLILSSLAAGDKTVMLGSSEPADGTIDVAVDTEFVLTFTSNVINMKVSDNNMTCFKLLDEKAAPVDIEVLMADDQIEPEFKRIIRIKSEDLLNKDSAYSIVVSGKLKAKNGSEMGQNVTISFRTAP